MPEVNNPRLPNWIALGGSGGTNGGGLSATNLNNIASTPQEKTATVAAVDTLLPVAYGRVNLPGLLFATGKIGTDLVVGYMWCVGEIEEIESVYINDEDPPVGITITHYTGTSTQGVDPTLASAIAAYNDTVRIQVPSGYRGAAYTVLRIPTGVIDAWPRVRATIKGRKLYDPRIDTTVYSDNPSLCFADMVTDPDYGLNSEVFGVEACADWNDELLGGVIPRARLSLVINSGRKVDDYLKVLAEYAECWYSREGSGVRMIPDRAVDLSTVPTVDPSTIIKDSLSVECVDSTDSPTEVEIRYTTPTTTSEPWITSSVTQRLTGVSEGTVERIPTSISLEGVYRPEEASNRALARLNKQSNRINVSWTSTDYGLVRQIGDVVKVIHPQRGVDIPVRIMQVDMIGASRYSINASRYDASYYPSEVILPDDEGIVPEGVIALLDGDTVPDGWADYTAANGRYIIGAGGAYVIGATGGQSTYSASGSTEVGGSHRASATGGAIATPAYSSGSGNTAVINTSSTTNGGHTHTYNTGIRSPSIYSRANRLVIKTGGDGLTIPSNIFVFGLNNLQTDAEKFTGFNGRIFKSDLTSSLFGAAGPDAYTITSGSTSDTHFHGDPLNRLFTGTPGLTNTYRYLQGGGLHSHQLFIQATKNLKRIGIDLYGSGNEYTVRPGTIFMWAGDINTLPADFVLCDGANGTPDTRDYFIQFGDAVPTGDNTIRLNATSSTVGHSHKGSQYSTTYVNGTTEYHSNTHTHGHEIINDSVPYTPEYYALAFIMYAPAG